MQLRNKKKYTIPVCYQKRKTRMSREQLIQRIIDIVLKNTFLTNELSIHELIIQTFPNGELDKTWNKNTNYIKDKISNAYFRDLFENIY